MVLRPRKFKFKNIHKRRKNTFIPRKGSLVYGQAGLMLLQPLRLQSKQIFRFKLVLKKSTRRADKTSRRSWMTAFPHIPLSKKVEGSRMGKGKGKLAGWVSELSAGVILFEVKNLRPGRATYYINQLRFRLPVKSQMLVHYTKYLGLPINHSRKVSFFTIW